MGTLKNKITNKPAFSDRAVLFYLGQHHEDFLPGQRPPNHDTYRPSIFVSGHTNSDGTFEFRLGPGDYMFRPGDHDEVFHFTVAGEEVLEIDPTTVKGAMTQIKGQAVSAEDGKPVPGAKVLVILDQFIGDRWETVADDDGHFSLPAREEPGAIQIISPDQSLIVIERFEEKDHPTVFELGPPGIVRGRLVDNRGRPVPDHRVEVGERNHYGGRFSNFAVTDEDGRFELTCLAKGWEYEFSSHAMRPKLLDRWFFVGSGDTFDIGEVTRTPPNSR